MRLPLPANLSVVLAAAMGVTTACASEEEGPLPVKLDIRVEDASHECVTDETEELKAATCAELRLLDPDSQVRVYDESGQQIGSGQVPTTSGWQDGELMPGWSFDVRIEPTASQTLTVEIDGCDLTLPGRGREDLVRPKGTGVEEGEGGEITPHAHAKLFVEVVDDARTGKLRCQAARDRHAPTR